MSGGVDSSVAAYLLKEAGYDVIGVTMQIWQDEAEEVKSENGGCCGLSAVDDARRVAETIGIPYYVMNFKKEFQCQVIDYFVQEYLHGRTPNPCIACNRYVKWEALLNRSLEIGADYIATGHYAKIQWSKEYKQYVLTKSKADKKDQTYFLYPIPQNLLDKILFPLADFTDKTEIRKIAEENSLNVAKKKDSQEICFIPNNNYITFLEQNGVKKQKQGNIVLKDGTILGKHKGLIYYTIGQRKGLGISYEEPLYVLKLDKEKNEVIVGPEKELYKNTLQDNSHFQHNKNTLYTYKNHNFN